MNNNEDIWKGLINLVFMRQILFSTFEKFVIYKITTHFVRTVLTIPLYKYRLFIEFTKFPLNSYL